MKKVVFMGTPEFSVNILNMLIENYDVVLVCTQPDKEVGRKKVLTPSPVKRLALEHNIPLFQPEKIKEDYQKIIDVNPDIIITCAYGQIIPKELLDFPKYGAINVHASILPKLRGGAPIHKAIINGYQETGITIMYMDVKMDSGDIIKQEKVEILDTDTYRSLHDKLSIVGRDLLKDVLPSIFNKTNERIKQDEDLVTYGFNIKREEELIDFNKPCREVFNHIRGLNDNPGAYALLNDEILKIFDVEMGSETSSSPGVITNISKDAICVACQDKEIIIKSLKKQGKNKMTVKEYLNGVNKEKLLSSVFNKGI